jgi:hypothetical protein
MVMFVSYPWPVPSANVYPAGLAPPAVGTDPADAMAETGSLRDRQVEEIVCWTRRERLRLLWFRVRLAAGASHRGSRRAQQPQQRLP